MRERGLRKRGLAALALVVLLSACRYNRSTIVIDAPIGNVVAVAHRGRVNPTYADNSLGAIKYSIQRGVQSVELDMVLSADKKVFLFHDTQITPENSLPNAFIGRSVSSIHSRDLEKIQVQGGGEAGIPSLDQALNIIASSPVTVQADLKEASEDMFTRVVSAFEKRAMTDRVVVQFKRLPLLREFARRYPHVSTLVRCGDLACLNQAMESSACIIEFERWNDDEAVKKAHAASKRVLINVILSPFDNAEGWSILREKGIDRILTAHADELQAIIDLSTGREK